MMVLRSSAWSLPWEKVLLMMLLTPFGGDLWNTLLYHLEALQLSFSPFLLCSFPTLSEGYNTRGCGRRPNFAYLCYTSFSTLKRVVKGHGSCRPQRASIHTNPEKVKYKCTRGTAQRCLSREEHRII